MCECVCVYAVGIVAEDFWNLKWSDEEKLLFFNSSIEMKWNEMNPVKLVSFECCTKWNRLDFPKQSIK